MIVLVFSAIAMTMIINGTVVFATMENKAALFKHNNEMAFHVAEAGIEYYRWHLAHAPSDYQDGKGVPGPYVHDFKDKDGNILGQFTLDIVPPVLGTSIVTVTSTGYILDQPFTHRKVQVRLGFPSLADYAFLTNSDVWVGDNEVIHGKMHANGGIRFDGINDAQITSAKTTYVCSPVFGSGCNNSIKPGIWGAGGPQSFWQFPVPAFDFNAITVDLSKIKTNAQTGGIYKSSSGAYGYHIKFKADNTFDLYKVTALKPIPSPGYGQDVGGVKHYESYDIKTETFVSNIANPTNGYIFIEDQIWVEGTVKGHITIGSGKFPVNPNTYTSIIIPNNILYTAKDGTDSLGLIAQNNIILPRYSPDILEIDAAVIAQNGSAQRFYYNGNILTSLTMYGSVISNGVWTWSWVTQGGSVVSGYRNTYSNYDSNLTYGPPPGFPTGNVYNLISWKEIR